MLIKYIPENFHEIYDIKQLFFILEDELKEIQQNLQVYKDNLFIASAQQEVLQRYTKIFGVFGENTQELRQKIILKQSQIPPFSLLDVENICEIYIDVYKIELKPEKIMNVYFLSDSAKDVHILQEKMKKKVYEIIPANIYFQLVQKIFTYLEYKKHTYAIIQDYTYAKLKYGK